VKDHHTNCASGTTLHFLYHPPTTTRAIALKSRAVRSKNKCKLDPNELFGLEADIYFFLHLLVSRSEIQLLLAIERRWRRGRGGGVLQFFIVYFSSLRVPCRFLLPMRCCPEWKRAEEVAGLRWGVPCERSWIARAAPQATPR
jgi:hypothetical protein